MTIGTREDAIRASKGQLKLIGQGAFRDVFVNDDNTVVYKVCTDHFSCHSDCNREERICYQEMADKGYKCIAETYSWPVGSHVVNAQPYMNGKVDVAKRDELRNMLRGYIYDIDFYDGGNIAFDNDGNPVVVDLQFFDPTGNNQMIERMVL